MTQNDTTYSLAGSTRGIGEVIRWRGGYGVSIGYLNHDGVLMLQEPMTEISPSLVLLLAPFHHAIPHEKGADDGKS